MKDATLFMLILATVNQFVDFFAFSDELQKKAGIKNLSIFTLVHL